MVVAASVNAPFSKPKSSLSIKFSGIAAIFKAINAASFLSEFAWINLAKTSLPTPLSPLSMTEASVLAAFSAIFSVASSAFEVAKNPLFSLLVSTFFMLFGVFCFSASTLFIASYSVETSNGLVKKSFTPSLTLSIALLSVAFPVIMMTSNLPFSSLMNSSPSIFGMFMSVMIRSVSSLSFFRASTALL